MFWQLHHSFSGTKSLPPWGRLQTQPRRLLLAALQTTPPLTRICVIHQRFRLWFQVRHSKLFYHLGINWFNFVNLLLGPDKLSGSSRQPPNQQPCYLHSVQHSPKKSTVIQQQQLPPASQSPPFFIPHRYFFPRKWWVKLLWLHSSATFMQVLPN